MSTSLQKPFLKWPRFPFWFRLRHALKRQRREIRKMFDKDDRSMQLMAELASYAAPIRRTMLQYGLPLEELKIVLGKKSWPKQYKAGITKIVGMEIDWREGNV